MPEPARENIVVAMTAEGVIGTGTGLPWHLPAELQHFRTLTWGGTLILGRRTFAGIGRPLPGRRMLVVSSTLPPRAGITVCADFAGAVALALDDAAPIFYIGGRSIYRQALSRAELLLVSWIHARHPGTVRFPDWDREHWREEGCDTYPDFTFCRYRRAAEPPVPRRPP